jgi:predicted nucleic acid-binding protein
MTVHSLSHSIVQRYALIRRELRASRSGLIGDIDTLIAATAMETGLTLVSSDRDFLRLPQIDLCLLAPRTFEIITKRPAATERPP